MQQFVEPVDHVIVDAIEDVGEVGLRVEAVHLGRLGDGHGARGFATSVGACKEPVLPPDANGLQGTLGRIVVDGHAAVLKEQAERRPAAEAVAEGTGEIALAGDARELLLGPGAEGLDLGLALLATDRPADIGGLPRDLAFDVIKRADTVQCLAGNR